MGAAMSYMRQIFEASTKMKSIRVAAYPTRQAIQAFHERFSWQTVGAMFVRELERA